MLILRACLYVSHLKTWVDFTMFHMVEKMGDSPMVRPNARHVVVFQESTMAQ